MPCSGPYTTHQARSSAQRLPRRVREIGAVLVQVQQQPGARRLSGQERDLIEKIGHVLGLVQGKWKVELIFLMAHGVRRHCRLLDCLPCASKKAMTDALRALERDGFVSRCVFAEVPLRVEYSLTPLGWAFVEPLMMLAEWDEAHSVTVSDARLEYRLRMTAELAGPSRLPPARASR